MEWPVQPRELAVGAHSELPALVAPPDLDTLPRRVGGGGARLALAEFHKGESSHGAGPLEGRRCSPPCRGGSSLAS